MKTDRYVVGFAGSWQVVYGRKPKKGKCWDSVYPIPLKSAERQARAAGQIIYRLVPVRRVKAERRKG